MRFFTKKIATKDIRTDPALCPKHDDEFDRLFEAAMKGHLPVYFAAVPLALCVPFDLDYRPDLHPLGKRTIEQIKSEWQRNNFQNLIVYPRGKWLVVSDDYIQLFAALEGRPDYLPCLVLGKPENDLLRDVQGPIAPADVPKLLMSGIIVTARRSTDSGDGRSDP